MSLIQEQTTLRGRHQKEPNQFDEANGLASQDRAAIVFDWRTPNAPLIL